MTARDVTAHGVSIGAMPGHKVATVSEWTNPHGATFTEWTARCGATGTESGAFMTAGHLTSPFMPQDRVYRKSRCGGCWS